MNGSEGESPAAAHRGAFGEYGGDAGGFIDRAFRERIVLVGVVTPDVTTTAVAESLEELACLVDTAGADPVQRVMQRRDRPDPATYVGPGKAQEIRDISDDCDADTVVFDDELSPAQQRNLERVLGRTAIDRTTVILDIFAQNASSVEGKVQVELAQLRYRLPRLRGAGNRLSQQAGESAREVPARPSWRWTDAACCAASTAWSAGCATSAAIAVSRRGDGNARRCPRSPSWATPTPASPAF